MTLLIIVVVTVFCLIVVIGGCALSTMYKVDELEDKVAELEACLDKLKALQKEKGIK